ncbi:MAG: 50S ribosomal protein L18 [Candidatus Yanofskybacteria bacterium GW2011_GWA1_44_21]|uniref:Large ribosomal subunit protein uL18 n=2 Tax=Candidatus Yanofskyibacteriota TaxID=1752733 RepID=A0A1F8H156_9BACT|nr:MAG: 50S ribosomal protein L18 [Candidatus Yanofskybacteria bacterium GW2011_GWA2_44_10]KKT50702.1 MAG: 50S ribosomal protein L18 [Candidatus Yanofskybacteria bacterium GW2011_GWA1_44_21]KKT90230.1 MAG: 50S ribosomal protein L18 [Candidatus Yanofskybacteria bacterium GW2011_GWB1_45_11]OGN02207.1 MAG: 50S ribosomal protein L18 [Candidatus Yanofskybacteria bacterium RIFCSPHIGHO2_01_FULL_44_110b]OGN14833.1 MAG: 50S ribosomal protein L18 [Candidatus Yanofskybacteria bacterium RIFCSPHIGHO2_02_FUL
MNTKREKRIRRHNRVRATIIGTAKKPRVSVFKSNKNVFIQFIDDVSGKTILGNSIGGKTKTKGNKTEKASSTAESMAKKAVDLGITEAVFDRGGFKYHGRVKAVAEGLRKGGIKF